MTESFEIIQADHLTTGAIGPPGERVFYIQARQGERTVSLRLEKTQVAALCRYLEAMLDDLPAPGPLPEDMDLIQPVVAEWIVGSLGVSYDEDDDRILVVAEELVEEGEEGSRARILATREQIAAFVRHGTAVVAAGRPPCPLCGTPQDPQGHMCVRLNGHRELAP